MSRKRCCPRSPVSTRPRTFLDPRRRRAGGRRLDHRLAVRSCRRPLPPMERAVARLGRGRGTGVADAPVAGRISVPLARRCPPDCRSGARREEAATPARASLGELRRLVVRNRSWRSCCPSSFSDQIWKPTWADVKLVLVRPAPRPDCERVIRNQLKRTSSPGDQSSAGARSTFARTPDCLPPALDDIARRNAA